MRWTTVKELLEQKGHGVVGVEASTTASACALHMTQRSVGSVLVLREGRLEGIVTWHDILKLAGQQPHALSTIQAREIMSEAPKTASETDRLDQVEALMIKNNIRHVPVIREDRVVGLVTRIDVLARYKNPEEALDAFIWGAIV